MNDLGLKKLSTWNDKHFHEQQHAQVTLLQKVKTPQKSSMLKSQEQQSLLETRWRNSAADLAESITHFLCKWKIGAIKEKKVVCEIISCLFFYASFDYLKFKWPAGKQTQTCEHLVHSAGRRCSKCQGKEGGKEIWCGKFNSLPLFLPATLFTTLSTPRNKKKNFI